MVQESLSTNLSRQVRETERDPAPAHPTHKTRMSSFPFCVLLSSGGASRQPEAPDLTDRQTDRQADGIIFSHV